jgi:hypothetical protein
MKSLIKFCRSRKTEVTGIDIHTMNGLIEQVDEAAKKIFNSNAIELLNEPITNVIAAVWGVQTDKHQPTSTQWQIAHIIRPVIRKIRDAIETGELSESKDCIIDYLIKRLVVSEIVFMIQCYKLGLLSREQSKSHGTYNLVDIQVAGHA